MVNYVLCIIIFSLSEAQFKDHKCVNIYNIELITSCLSTQMKMIENTLCNKMGTKTFDFKCSPLKNKQQIPIWKRNSTFIRLPGYERNY